MRAHIFLSISAMTIGFYSVTANAWNAVGHQVVAHIAYQQLEPSVKKKVDSLVSVMNQNYADINSIEALSVWPDKLRSQKIDTYTHWHYIDMPIIEKGIDAHSEMDTDNAVWAIQKIKPVVANNQANRFERARFLAFLVHIVGDLHQPLHTSSLFSAKHPKGDRGGNDYSVSFHNKKINLHALWDKGVGAFEGSAKTSNIDGIANALMRSYPKAYFADRADNVNEKTWVDEGVKNASDTVYATPEDQAVSQLYINNGRKLAEEEATLAGYRLGALLNQLLA